MGIFVLNDKIAVNETDTWGFISEHLGEIYQIKQSYHLLVLAEYLGGNGENMSSLLHTVPEVELLSWDGLKINKQKNILFRMFILLIIIQCAIFNIIINLFIKELSFFFPCSKDERKKCLYKCVDTYSSQLRSHKAFPWEWRLI